MKRSKFTEQQILFALKQAETGVAVAEVCRKIGISEATFYNWKKKYDGLGTAELRRLRQLEEENLRLKQIVADLTLDKQMLQDVLKKSSEGRAAKASCKWVGGWLPRLGNESVLGRYDIEGGVSLRRSQARRPCDKAADQGDSGDPCEVWILAYRDIAETRRLEGQSQADVPYLQGGRLELKEQATETIEGCGTQIGATGPDSPARMLEHGFRGGSAVRRAKIQGLNFSR